MLKNVIIISLNSRASSCPASSCECDLIPRYCGSAVLPDSRLCAPQSDLVSDRHHFIIPLRKGQSTGQFLSGDQLGSQPGCWTVPVQSLKRPWRESGCRLAGGPRYCAAPGQTLSSCGLMSPTVMCFPLPPSKPQHELYTARKIEPCMFQISKINVILDWWLRLETNSRANRWSVSHCEHLLSDCHHYYTIIVRALLIIHFAMSAVSEAFCQVIVLNSS